MDEPRGPNRAFSDRQAELAQISRDSKILDSRIDYWCFRCGVDAGPRRKLLAQGRSVAFAERRRGHLVVVHRIHPEELL